MSTIPPRIRGLLVGLAVAGLVLVVLVATGVIGSDASLARERLAQAASSRAPSEADQYVANTTNELSDGVNDAEDLAVLGLTELQLARETADPAHYARAETAFNRSLEIDPQNVDALIGQGTLALARHEFADALEIGQRAVALRPSTARIYGIIGDAQVELGRLEDALVTIQQMVDLRPDLASYSRVSYLRELHGDLPGAIAAMELAVDAGGPSPENTEYVRVQLGNLHFASGDLADAERTYRTSLARLPGYVYATAGMARVRAAEGRLDEAIQLYEEAAARIPLPEFVIALGETYEAAGRINEARDQYALVEAMQTLLEANGVRTDVELASYFADHGDAARAVDLARGAYERTPSIRAADALAWSLFANGDVAEAATYADAAMALDSADSRILYHAGLIAEAAGNTNLAAERLARAIELNPEFSPLYGPRAAEALARVADDN
ncbi:MAG: tetratricopeptide repeat protein [Candidatus Limnocylindria bacterium]